MKAWIDTVSNTCGVGEIYGFNEPPGWCDPDEIAPEDVKQQGGGIGYNIAGFIDTADCEVAYEEFKQDYDIVYQSPVKRNKNSGNDFFFIVFKLKD